MDNELDLIVSSLVFKKDKERMNQLILDYQPFILNTVSSVRNRYISAENDEEFSIGLMAFSEAIERYDIHKGSFLHFAKLVITSRIRTYLLREQKNAYIPLEELDSSQMIQLSQQENDLREEIILFEQKLNLFGIDFEDLIDSSPKHKDTREKAIEISIKASGEKDLIDHLYKKRRLPVTKMAERFFVSVKIIKNNKLFITAAIVVIVNQFSGILDWIKNSGKGPQN